MTYIDQCEGKFRVKKLEEKRMRDYNALQYFMRYIVRLSIAYCANFYEM